MPKTTITRAEYQQLLGLKLLADRYDRQVKELIHAAGEIIGEEEPDRGHCSDLMYGNRDVDELLRILKITVEREPRQL